jgi:hypothetical protein
MAAFLWRELKIKFLLASMKSLILCIGENQPTTVKESRNKFDAAFKTMVRISRFFNETSRNFIIIFVFQKAA